MMGNMMFGPTWSDTKATRRDFKLAADWLRQDYWAQAGQHDRADRQDKFRVKESTENEHV